MEEATQRERAARVACQIQLPTHGVITNRGEKGFRCQLVSLLRAFFSHSFFYVLFFITLSLSPSLTLAVHPSLFSLAALQFLFYFKSLSLSCLSHSTKPRVFLCATPQPPAPVPKPLPAASASVPNPRPSPGQPRAGQWRRRRLTPPLLSAVAHRDAYCSPNVVRRV